MTHCRKRTGSRPQGGLPVRFGRKATWMLVLGTALTLSALSPAGRAASGAAAATRAVVPEPPRYTLVSLGTLGGETSRATAINARGDVVGDSALADGSTHGFLWRNGRMADLGVLPGSDVSSAQDINDRGDIVGVSGFEDGPRSAVIWRNGAIKALGTLPGGLVSIATAINEAGTVVGVSQSRTGNHAFVWENGTMRDLGTLPGGSFSLARGINDAGVIVGQADAADGTVHATRWTASGIEDLGRIRTSSGAAATSIAYAVGSDGLVVGYGTTDSGALGAVWTGTAPSPVAALTGYAVAELRALNDFRQAVGDATDANENRKIAVIVDLRRVPKSIPALFDLNTLVMNGAGWTVDSGSDINDSWEIVGTGVFDGPTRAILLRPRPFALTVERTGTGVGSVNGPASMVCGTRCGALVKPGTAVTLVAAPAKGSRFVRWQGACSGTARVCKTSVDGALTARAVFAELPKPCRCTAISTTASLRGSTRLAGGALRVQLSIDWRLSCAAGTGGRCDGRLQIEPAGPGVTLASPAGGAVGCRGTCPGAGVRVASGSQAATIDVASTSNRRVTLLVRKYCVSGGRMQAVGVDRVELTLAASG